MRKRIQQQDILSPENVLSNLIQDYIAGTLDDYRVLFRASVVAVDHVGGQFEPDPVPNPKNSIKARVFTNGLDSFTADDDLPVFWPLFSHDVMPVKEREHVYIIFEDEKRQHGLWISRIPEPNNVDSKNFVDGVAPYVNYSQNNLDSGNAEQVVQDLLAPPAPVNVSDEFVVESDVPFVPRVGDRVIAGSNNALIVVGRDRPGNRQSGQQNQAGTVDIVAGRQTSDDMDIANDKARVYISELTDVDANAGTSGVGQSSQPSSAVICVGDQIRIVARQGVKVVVTGGDLTIEGTNINVGNNATQNAVLGNQLVQLLTNILTALTATTVTTLVGPAPLNNAATFANYATQLNSILSQTVKVKA